MDGAIVTSIAPVPASGEVAVINNDAFIYLADGNGNVRSILPNIYADPFVDIQPVAIGVDPTTSRVWLADGIFKQIWSISTDATPDEERLEVGFALKPESRPDSNIAFHDPGLEFSADGSILVVTDGSTGNGGGRLHIFHDEEPQAAVTLTSAVRTAEGFELDWTGAEGATYRVQRVTNLGGQFQDISGDLTATEFTDDNPPADHAFYRVVVMP